MSDELVIWPPDYLAEYKRRFNLFHHYEHDPLFRMAADMHYKENPWDWINDWCITFNPRNVDPIPRLLPFMLFQKQREFVEFLLDCLTDKESGLVEKARDIGATWLCCAFAVWLWKYWDGTVIGFGSRKEEYVDKKGDPKAIFPKLRQIIEYLPSYMQPPGFSLDTHATYMRILNPANGSAITGEAGDNIGRGGRTTIFFKDESAHYERPELVEAALGDNTDVQIDISSVNGSANVFYRRRMAGQIWHPGAEMEKGRTRVFIFDWRDHPGKSQEWYENRRKKAEAEGMLHIFAQEVDRDYSGSMDKIIIPAAWVNAAVDAHIKLKFSDDGECVAGQDIADGGGDKNALCIRKGVVLRFADHWSGDAGDAPKISIPHCIEFGVKELDYDVVGVGAGFKTGIKTMRENGSLPRHLKIVPWNGGSTPIHPEKHIIPNDKESPTNKDQYLNLKAQAWFRLRTRFYKTYRAVMHGDVYPSAELISLDSTIPKLHELKMELSQAVYDTNGKGKTIVDKKPDGSLSPNLADGCVICYCPNRPPAGFFSV